MSAFELQKDAVVTRVGAVPIDDAVASRVAHLASGRFNGALVLIVTEDVAVMGSVSAVSKRGEDLTVSLDPALRLLERRGGTWVDVAPPLSTAITFALGDAGTRAHVYTHTVARATVAKMMATST